VLSIAWVLPSTANAQFTVFDPTNYANNIRADAAAQLAHAQQLAQQIQQTAQLMSQVQTMIKDHVALSTILQGQGGQLISTIGQNTSIISTDMTTDSKTLSDFKKVAPTYDGSQAYINYYATLKANANAQYASALSETQTDLQSEGGVASAVQAIANTHATNQLQALQQILGVGQIQTSQMDRLIKIQARMLKSMNTYYAAQTGNTLGTTLPSAQTEATYQYCSAKVPGFAQLSPSARSQALQNCQTQMTNAANTQNGGGS
jgi:hypothetical protein